MDLFPELDVVPGRGQIMITEPINDLKFKGTFHIEEGYFYFRNVGNRVLIGGGRHLDFKGEETLQNGIHPEIEKELLRILKEDVLPNQEFSVSQQWSGIMAFGAIKKPILEWINKDTLLAVRLGGMGMAIGSELGELVSLEIEKTIHKKEI
jgi:glycine/D-amino acid oxidase-like deaminating enzyme